MARRRWPPTRYRIRNLTGSSTAWTETMLALRFETPHRITARRAVAGSLLAVAVSVGLVMAPSSARAATGPTIVSLTFDDGSAGEDWPLGHLGRYNMPCPFHITSAHAGPPPLTI